MIDPQLIQRAKEADLLAVIGGATRLKRVSASEGGEYAGPCPMCGGRDRFRVQPARGRWLCRRCTTGKWSDAIALHRALNHSSFDEAVRALCGGELAYAPRPPLEAPIRNPPSAIQQAEPPAPLWQARARDVIAEAQHHLWSSEAGAFDVRHWLERQRGLSYSLLRLWQIGWLPEPIREPAEWWGLPAEAKPVYLAAGVLIPCVVDQAVWYLKVRRLGEAPDPKYVHVRGSHPALYLADTITPATRVVALTEGEFDGLVLLQAVRARRWPQPVGVGTFGAATSRLREPWTGRLAGKQLITLYDGDEAGQAATAWWQAHFPSAVAVPIASPRAGVPVKDVTDYWRAGGKVAELVAQAI
jgi:DNA primase